jgi:hypothetical protein
MPNMDAVLRMQPLLTSGRTQRVRPAVPYEQFRDMAWHASRQIEETEPQRRGVVPIPRLRRSLADIPPAIFNQHVLRLERNGLVYLIPPEDPDALTEEARSLSIAHPSGDLRSFLLWMRPRGRVRTNVFLWD